MITSLRIKEDQRIKHTVELFGIHFPLAVEPAIYQFTERLSPDYSGGYWQFYQLASGGFYMAPDTDNIFNICCDNGFEGIMTADALGITACIYTYSYISFSENPDLADICAEQYHLLREFMMEHAEVRTILSATDWQNKRTIKKKGVKQWIHQPTYW